jgi:hypothetical protein
MVHACNQNTWEADMEKSQVQLQSSLPYEFETNLENLVRPYLKEYHLVFHKHAQFYVFMTQLKVTLI